MKIAMLADRLVMGGVETHIVTLVNELLRRGHRVLLNTAYTNPELLTAIDCGYGQFKQVNWSEAPVADVRRFDPDVIHSHPFTAIFRGLEVATRLRKPFFVTMHGLYDFGVDRSPLGNAVTERVKTIIAVDRQVAELLSRCTAHPQKIQVVYNGIDLRKFGPLVPSKLNVGKVKTVSAWPTLVVVSRMADGKEKPVAQLLECATALADQLQGLNLIVVGDGVFYSQLQTKAEALTGCEWLRLWLTGGQTEVVPFLAAADLVLACDRAAMEAMACGRAVFGMSAAGFAGPIDWENFEAVLLRRSNYQPLSDAELTVALASLLQDKARLATLASANRQIALQYFDSVAMADQLEQIYQQK